MQQVHVRNQTKDCVTYRNDTSHHPQDGEGIDFEVGVLRTGLVAIDTAGLDRVVQIPLGDGNEGIVLFVAIDIFHNAFFEQISNGQSPEDEGLNLSLLEFGQSGVWIDKEEGSAHPSTIRREVDGPLRFVPIH